jgi:hypothetical protein
MFSLLIRVRSATKNNLMKSIKISKAYYFLRQINSTSLKSRIIYLLFFLAHLFFSCTSSTDIKIIKVSPEFKIYVDRFVQEARNRKRIISVDDLEVKFGAVQNGCWSTNLSVVTIDRNCWNNYPEVVREIVLFNALGYSILQRNTSNALLPNGDYASIMCENPLYLYNEYVPEKRSYYLDELFGSVNGIPSWALIKTKESVILNEKISVDSKWLYKIANGANHQGTIVSTIFSSPSYSLAIQSIASSSGFSYWQYNFMPENIEVGSDLLLKVKVKATGLTNGGAYLYFNAFVDNEVVFVYTTKGKDISIGTHDFKEYTIKVNYFPEKVTELNIFLVLDGTSSGSVNFDDIQLLKYN